MRAAPGAVLDDLSLVLWGMLLQVLAIVCKPGNSLLLDVLERISQSHVAVRVVVSVALTVGGDVHELRPIAGIGKSSCQTVRELLAAVQQPFESYGLGDWSVIKKDGDAAPIPQTNKVGPCRIDLSRRRIAISPGSNPAEAPGLVR